MNDCIDLKSLRKFLGLTQAAMAKQLRITRSCYAELETGRKEPSPMLAELIRMTAAASGFEYENSMGSSCRLGSRIRETRRQMGLTQGDLALVLRKTNSSISDWERGRATPSLGEILVLAKTLACTPEELAFGESAETRIQAQPLRSTANSKANKFLAMHKEARAISNGDEALFEVLYLHLCSAYIEGLLQSNPKPYTQDPTPGAKRP